VSPPVGPTGLPYECDGTAGETPWTAGVSVSAFSTTIGFGDTRVRLREQSAVASLGYHAGPRWGVTASLGAVLGGGATIRETAGDVGAGIVGSLTGNWLAIYERARRPFLLSSLTLGASAVTAVSDDGQRNRLRALDVRLAILVGKTFGRLVPFAGARAFGGPVSWRIGGQSVVGGDIHHYAVGAGVIARLPGHLGLFAEAMPLGEQSLTGGLTFSY
jgi:hypothetical protein